MVVVVMTTTTTTTTTTTAAAAAAASTKIEEGICQEIKNNSEIQVEHQV